MLQNFTLDDASPLIRYDASWSDGYNSTADSQMPRYQGRSFYVTHTNGATANITFRGTDIYLYGAKRNNHGYYSVMVDNEPSVPMSGRPAAGTDELFQTLLFARQGLTNGDHTLVLTNEIEDQEKVWLDVDYIVITREVETPVVPSVIATHEEFTYSSLWSTQSGMTGYRNSTTHRTNTPGETATLKFHGSELFLYGGVGPDFGTFKVQVDSQEPVVLNATRGFTHPPVTLFTTSGLDDGQHTLTITNLEGGKSLTIDYAEYTPASGPSRSNAGLIGGVLGGVLGALVVLALLGWFFIRRRKQARNNAMNEPLPPITTSPQWNNHAQLTPYVENPSQPPVGYVGYGSEALGTHTPTARKTDMVVSPLATIRSDESTYESTLQQHGLSSLGSPTDIASIHEVDAGALTLPPMYDQVFSTPPPPRNPAPTQT
ncbi:hypothetical protein ACGC1H_000292 [Rhizoctonia solani]|uniref:Transmembrane protein n=1 Tax=Rhizoctonia solani TaxID=456999 RepID=A0A8H2WRS0_9AGAM|nr:unnamed protein product [Rhizoctonia solani]